MDNKVFRTAYSHYFGRDIMCIKYNNDNDWYFCFIDKQKNPISKICKAKTNYSLFIWNK